MKSCLLVIIFSLSFGKIDFTPHDINISDKGIISLHSAEINGDGNTDILRINKDTNEILWHENLGEGEYYSAAPLALGHAMYELADISTIDLDGDGNLDILIYFLLYQDLGKGYADNKNEKLHGLLRSVILYD